MEKFFIPPLRLLFPEVQWYGPDSAIYLTFDDGPHPVATPIVLDILRKERIRGTFFLVGECAQAYPDIVAEIVREGHTVGNHTFLHKRIWLSRKAFLDSEIGGAQRAIETVSGVRPSLFRPPFNRIDPWSVRYIHSMGLRTVQFSINSWDFIEQPVARIVRRITRPCRKGDIIAFHDNDQTVRRIGTYLSAAIAQLKKTGHKFAPLV